MPRPQFDVDVRFYDELLKKAIVTRRVSFTEDLNRWDPVNQTKTYMAQVIGDDKRQALIAILEDGGITVEKSRNHSVLKQTSNFVVIVGQEDKLKTLAPLD